MSENSAQSKKSSVQELCIDLPGESVQCWRSADNIRVILRKHRDVIFDLKLADGNIYTIEATHADFYNPRDKKLISVKSRDSVAFKDGERMHVWVSREFSGALLLKCRGQVLMRLEPNRLDNHQYDKSPHTKPAPIIVAFDSQGAVSLSSRNNPRSSTPAVPRPAAAPVHEDIATICVLDKEVNDIPAEILDYFGKGGGSTGLVEIDVFNITNRNWLWAQAAGTAAYIGANWDWLRASIDRRTHDGLRLVSVKAHHIRGKIRFYFSGYSKYNSVFGPGGFGPGHERILNIFGGAGKLSTQFVAAGTSIMGTLKGNALVALIFGSAISVAEWKEDLRKDGFDLAAALLTNLFKVMLTAFITSLIVGAIVVFVLVVLKAGLSVLVIGGATLVVGFGIGYGIDLSDKLLAKAISNKDDANSIAEIVAPVLRAAGEKVISHWNYLVWKFKSDYRVEVF